MVPNFVTKILCNPKWLDLIIPRKFAAFKLRSDASKCNTLESYVDLAFNGLVTFPFLAANIQPSQVKTEITQLLKILAKHKPKRILEIGTGRGGTLFLFTRIADANATLISVDLYGGNFGGGYPQAKTSIYESFVLQYQFIHLLRENSHSPCTFTMIKKILNSYPLDFLFIDGDHTYAGVKADFEMYSKLVRKCGLIALHDVCSHSPNADEVYRFWHEIRSEHDTLEIIENQSQGWAGIGVIYV
jgi:predicted O-methyltransferase YrrM